MLIRHDPDVGHIFVPNLRARLPNENGGYLLVTNAAGFRSDFEFRKERNGTPRVMMFGDSYTAGDAIPNHDRFSDRLQRMLGVEVQNYGVSGSATDQHLLIHRKFAREVQADLAIVCVQIDSLHRIQVSHRPILDRIVTGRRILVPKPYFVLVDGELQLRQVPVPSERLPEDAPIETGTGRKEDRWLEAVHQLYRHASWLKALRHSERFEDLGDRLKSEFVRLRGAHPYPDLRDYGTPGWQLMEAILRQFIKELKPLPVLIVPIPTKEFYWWGVRPIYQERFEQFDDPGGGVHVCDVSSPLVNLPWRIRSQLRDRVGGHFSALAGSLVAESLAEFVRTRKLLPDMSGVAITGLQPSRRAPALRGGAQYVLGISCFYHNSAAALLRDGEIVAAAEEERFTRIKNDRGFPHNAINYCLEEGGISQRDLAAIATYDNTALTFERICHSLMALDKKAACKMWLTAIPSWVRMKLHLPLLLREFMKYDGLILQGVHHRSHAASCFYPSPFDRAAILTVDGVGEWATASIGIGESNKVRLLREMRFPNSLGLLYSAFTQFTGFKVNSGEYKMMGLAPYGEPRYVQRILDNLVDIHPDGSLQLNLKYFGFLRDTEMCNAAFTDLFDGPARRPENRITRREMDLARSIQQVVEETMLRMARTAQRLTGESRLCMGGGVALNCVANGRVLREGPFADLWIQPAAGDAGAALGVALDVWHNYFGAGRKLREDRLSPQGGSYLGPGFSTEEIRSYLKTMAYPYRRMEGEERARYLAVRLSEGRVVGHFSGRLEYGPRALGARSILADARSATMQTELNLRIKYRESFRPFAPAVLLERVSEYFDLNRETPYMLIVAAVKQNRRRPLSPSAEDDNMLPIIQQQRSDIPAVTHVDYSARIQTVRREYHQEFYELIEQFRRETGYGLLVNTSFNVRGEPIVCTPQDAYRCFMRTEMDTLALGNFILLKEEQPAWTEGRGRSLENEDASPQSGFSHPPRLVAKLKRLFEADFWPEAVKLRRDNAVLVTEDPSAATTTWVDAADPVDLRAAFELGTPLRSASEFTRVWHGREAAKGLEPVLDKLINLGLRYRVKQELPEQVSESVYVMF
jgi:carbamoyltransferase